MFNKKLDRPAQGMTLPVCDDAFLLNSAAKIHSQTDAGQFTLDIAVVDGPARQRQAAVNADALPRGRAAGVGGSTPSRCTVANDRVRLERCLWPHDIADREYTLAQEGFHFAGKVHAGFSAMHRPTADDSRTPSRVCGGPVQSRRASQGGDRYRPSMRVAGRIRDRIL